MRNALIKNLQPIALRNDIGALWENFLMSESLKRMEYAKMRYNKYFWRTKYQQEIDYVEEREGKITAFEFKWNPDAKAAVPNAFEQAYSPDFKVVNRLNFREFVKG